MRSRPKLQTAHKTGEYAGPLGFCVLILGLGLILASAAGVI